MIDGNCGHKKGVAEILFFCSGGGKEGQSRKYRIISRGECKYAAEYVDDCKQVIIL
jgi:hypothetical protein